MQQAQIIETVKSLTKPTLAKIITRTLVRMNKFSKDKTEANPYNRVHMVSTMIVELNPTCKNSDSQSNAWGNRIGNGISERNGKLYVSVITKRSVMVNHLTFDSIVEKTDFVDFLPKQSSSSNQKVDNLVAYRTFSLDNILSIELL